MIPHEYIEELTRRTDIVELVGSYVQLKRKGRLYGGLCPFHSEKTPSFYVYPDTQSFYCFGCQAAGDAISFVKKINNISSGEAIKMLASRAGMPEPQEDDKTGRLRSRVLSMNKEAARFFHACLNSTVEEARQARAYWRRRGLDDKTIVRFGLGYAPNDGQALYQYLRDKGYNQQELDASGLFKRSQSGRIYCLFWKRVMTPIFDLRGNIIAFGGRVLDDSKPKYVNSPETLVYHKSDTVFALQIAKKSASRRFVLCEGYMDVISMHQAGFTNAVAALGTAFTSGHGTLLKRYTENVILSFDSDEAGQRAILRAIPILKEAGLTVRVLDLTPYKDPDEFIKGLGAQALEERIRKAMSSFMFQVKVAAGRYDQDDPESKTQFQHEAAKLLATIEEPLERKNYIEAVSREYYIGAKDLEDLVNYYGTSGYSSAQRQQTTPRQQERRLQVNEAKEEKKKQPQKLLLTWMVNEPQLFDKLEGIIGPDDFYEQIYHGVALLLFKQYEEEKAVIPGKILNQYTDLEDQKKIAELFNTTLKISPLAEDRDKALNDIVRRVKEDSIEQQMNATNDILRWQDLIKEKANLAKLHISL